MIENERYPEMESSFLEFKKEVPKNDQIIKTIIGFCNQKGGKLIIGIADDRAIVGLPDSTIEHLLESLDHAIYEASHPTILPLISLQRFGDKTVLVIIEGDNFVKCILPRPHQQQKAISQEPDVLSIFYSKDEITIHDVMSKFSVSRATAQRWLQSLLLANKIERHRKTRNVRYRKH